MRLSRSWASSRPRIRRASKKPAPAATIPTSAAVTCVARRARQHDLAASFVDLQGLERHRNHVSAKTKEAADVEDHERNVVLTNDNIGNSADALITIVPKSSPPQLSRTVTSLDLRNVGRDQNLFLRK